MDWPDRIPDRARSALGVGALLFDLGLTTDQTLGRRACSRLCFKRGRLNGLFAALLLAGSEIGAPAASAASTLAGAWSLRLLPALAFSR
jgi:hypothetical protein